MNFMQYVKLTPKLYKSNHLVQNLQLHSLKFFNNLLFFLLVNVFDTFGPDMSIFLAVRVYFYRALPPQFLSLICLQLFASPTLY